jgi:hypothetical protein
MRSMAGGDPTFMNRKPLAVWQNILLAIPIGAAGGAFAGFVIILGMNIPFLVQDLKDSLLFASGVAVMGSIIGVATFPLAYAIVGRTKNVFSIVPVGLVATVLGAWLGLGLLSGLNRSPWASIIIEDNGFWLFLLIPVIAMFGACAWAAARERRQIAGRP